MGIFEKRRARGFFSLSEVENLAIEFAFFNPGGKSGNEWDQSNECV